ncbi:MAG: hypothetical protein ACLPXZ_27460 [Mycobacterium sp.]
MSDPAPVNPTEPRSANTAPTITAHAGYVVTGAGFLPNHSLTIRVADIADNVSDYLAFSSDVRGGLYAELRTSPGSGTLHVTATDHRTDPLGAGGLLWSNTAILNARLVSCARNSMKI